MRDALGRLRVKELVVPHEPSSFTDEHEFAFRHGLIRDGAYDSLPKSLRADKHLGVARWAAERAGDRAEEIAELIATHEIEALRYLDELGRAAAGGRASRVRARVGGRAPDGGPVAWAPRAPAGTGRPSASADRLEIPLAERAQLASGSTRRSRGAGTPVAETERVARRAIEVVHARSATTAGWAGRTPASSFR